MTINTHSGNNFEPAASRRMEETAWRSLCQRAGVLPHEMSEDPELGLLISSTGVQKLKELSTDKYAKAFVGQLATKLARAAIRRVK